MKSGIPSRRVLHIDLDPFFISVERSLNPGLRGCPVVVGGDGHTGIVAAASSEAQAAGIQPGNMIRAARRLCPQAVFRAGDFETYARVSQDVTQILLSASRRVERPSADEAFVELSVPHSAPRHPFRVVDRIQDQIHRRLGLEASFGLASTRLAARIASRYAKPRGLLVLLPEHEADFVGRQSLDVLGESVASCLWHLNQAGLRTVNDLQDIGPEPLARLVGPAASVRLKDAVTLDRDPPIPVTAPPTAVHEEATIRDSEASRYDLESVLENLARRALRRIRPFDLHVQGVTIEVRRSDSQDRRTARFHDGIKDELVLVGALKNLFGPLLATPGSIHTILLRLGPLSVSPPQFSFLTGLDKLAKTV